MPKIDEPQVRSMVEHFEALVTACEDYIRSLEEKRAAHPGRAERPPYGTPEFRAFALNGQIDRNIALTRALLDLLEGAGYDRLRAVVDGLGTLKSAFRGEWV